MPGSKGQIKEAREWHACCGTLEMGTLDTVNAML